MFRTSVHLAPQGDYLQYFPVSIIVLIRLTFYIVCFYSVCKISVNNVNERRF